MTRDRVALPPILTVLGIAAAAAFATIAARPVLADVDTTPPVGSLVLYSGDPAANVLAISIETPATDDASGVSTVELSSNGSAWRAFAYPGPGAWDMGDAAYGGSTNDGVHTVYARWTDGTGNTSAPVSETIIYDPTPPVAAVTFNDGAIATNNPSLTIHIDATDNIGIETLQISTSGPPAKDVTMAFTPSVPWDLGAAAPDGFYDFSIAVRDLAVNTTAIQTSIYLDRTPPVLQEFLAPNQQAPDGTFTFSMSASDLGEVPFARFSSNGGASWGSPLPIVGNQVTWDPLDASQGGSAALGARVVSAQVRDTAGNWSGSRSVTVNVAAALELAVSAVPTTGKPITFSIDWLGTTTLPAGAMCLWEFMWGDDASIYLAERNETFGSLMTQGPASAGFCDHWTFTLPWTPVRQYLVAVRVMRSDWTDIGSALLGGSPGEVAFTSSVGSTSRHIATSNLPLFYVLPDAYELTAGEPAVYRGYAVGGASIKSTDVWTIDYVNVPERHPGSSVLTFIPKTTGHITVCLSRDYSSGRQLGACFDPPVQRGPSSDSSTAPPPAGSPDPSGTPVESPGASDVALVATPSGAPSGGGAAAPGPTSTPSDPAAAGTIDRAGLDWIALGALLALVVLVAGSAALAHPRVRAAVSAGLRRDRSGPA